MTTLTFAQSSKAKRRAFLSRLAKGIKTLSASALVKLGNDVLKHSFARYLLVDAYGTFMLFWTIKSAQRWIRCGAPELVRIVDLWDDVVVVERRQARAY